MLGGGALRPPKISKIPDLSSLHDLTPTTLGDGRPIDPVGPKLSEIDKLAAPDPEVVAGHRSRSKKPHWHVHGRDHYLHRAAAWGRWHDKRWSWYLKKGKRWWISAGPKKPPLLLHRGHWWWKQGKMWFILHDGEPWGFRYFSRWKREGFIHPGTGTQIVYSADGRRVAVITPGKGAALFDAYTGRLIRRFSESEMPKKPRPKPPPGSVTPW